MNNAYCHIFVFDIWVFVKSSSCLYWSCNVNLNYNERRIEYLYFHIRKCFFNKSSNVSKSYCTCPFWVMNQTVTFSLTIRIQYSFEVQHLKYKLAISSSLYFSDILDLHSFILKYLILDLILCWPPFEILIVWTLCIRFRTALTFNPSSNITIGIIFVYYIYFLNLIMLIRSWIGNEIAHNLSILALAVLFSIRFRELL